MIVKERGAPIPAGAIDDYVRSLEDQLRAMQMLRQYGRPTKAVLEAAPVLDRWTLHPVIEMALTGLSHGHPTLPGKGRPIVTSPLLLLAPDEGWARTHSRFYRLGLRAAETSQ